MYKILKKIRINNGNQKPVNLNSLEIDKINGNVQIINKETETDLEMSSDTKLANNLLNFVTFGNMPIDDQQCFILNDELKKNVTRNEQLLRVVDLVPSPKTAIEYGIVAEAYYYLGSKYRLRSLELLLIKKEKHGLVGMEIVYFASLLEREHFFEEAKKEYAEMIKGNPMFQGYYISLSDILRKENRLDDAIDFLKQARCLDYYTPYESSCSPLGYNDDFKVAIDRKLVELEDMKKRNYIYKSRKKR